MVGTATMSDRFRVVHRRKRPPVRCKPLSLSCSTSASCHRMDLRRTARRIHVKEEGEALATLNLIDVDGSALQNESAQDTKDSDEPLDSFSENENGSLDSFSTHYHGPKPECQICKTRHRVPLGSGVFSINILILEARAGQSCCSFVLDVLLTWFGRKELSSKKYPDSLSGFFVAVFTEHLLRVVIEFYPVQIEGCLHPKTIVSLSLYRSQNPASDEFDRYSSYNIPLRPLPSGDTASQRAFMCLGGWMHECRHNHRRCHPQQSSTYSPKRILEIEPTHIFLREAPTPGLKYACLSHCWGPKGVAFKLNASTVDVLKVGVVHSTLPKTFHDAIKVCLRLKIQFIWIDALCILQDNEDDWIEAAATMADIYENGFLTIAATAAPDSNAGLFSDPKSQFRARRLAGSNIHVAKMHHQDWNIYYGYTRDNFGSWPLLNRAWVFQERRMSTRIVHYTDVQLLWECNSMYKSESGDIDEDWSNQIYDVKDRKLVEIPFKYPMEKIQNTWRQAVEDYSALKLTFAKDRLPAIAAVVQRMMPLRGDDTYVAGMWKNSLLQDLTWRSIVYKEVGRPLDTLPTWSWASVDGPVVFNAGYILPGTRLTDTAFTHVGPPHLGYVVDASIEVGGPSCFISFQRHAGRLSPSRVVLEAQEFPRLNSVFNNLLYRDCGWCTGDRPVEEGTVFSVLFIQFHQFPGKICWDGLVLREVSKNKFERLGVVMVIVDHDPRHRKTEFNDNLEWRLWRHYLSSLPIRKFKII